MLVATEKKVACNHHSQFYKIYKNLSGTQRHFALKQDKAKHGFGSCFSPSNHVY